MNQSVKRAVKHEVMISHIDLINQDGNLINITDIKKRYF